MSDQNSSPNGRRRESVNSTSSDNFPYPFNHGSSHQNDANFKLSGKAWGRVKKFLLCKNAFPSSIYYIVGNEFCERFSYYGMKAILILYLTRVLAFGDNTATAVFHSFSMLCYFTPLFGAMMADGWLGKYRTILYVSMVYCFGNLIVSITSLPSLGAGEIPGPMIGLFLIALGTGGIKPCVSAFGGDQFTSDQTHLLQSFFSVFYFAINAGSLLSMLITPVLRGDVKCFKDDCYPLAFGVPAILMIIAIAFFWCGRHKYKSVPLTGNIVWTVVKAMSYALKRRITTKGEKKDHWMDWADDTYDAQLIQDIKALCKVLFMFLPLPVFWTLFDQQGSRWVLQAQQMDGDAGSKERRRSLYAGSIINITIEPDEYKNDNHGFLGTIKPDQMQALNALFIILLIPLFEGVVYPLFKRPRPLKRMCTGMFLASVAFVIAGFVQMKIQSADLVKDAPPSGQAILQVINTLQCPVTLNLENKNITVASHRKSSEQHLSVQKNLTLMITSPTNCNLSNASLSYSRDLKEKEWYNFVVGGVGTNNKLVGQLVKQNITLPPPGKAKLCIILLLLSSVDKTFDIWLDKDRIQEKVSAMGNSFCSVVSADHYKLTVKGRNSGQMYVSSQVVLKNGAIYTAVVQENKKAKTPTADVTLYEDVEAKSVSMLYQIPQYFVITSGEILFSITGLEFAYSQAPVSMKSCLQAAWLMTVAFGNLIVVIVAESHIFSNQTTEFFFFAAMLFVVMLVFMAMSLFYRYVDSPAGQSTVPIPVDINDDTVGITDMDELEQI